PKVTMITFGKVIDWGVGDVNNMGAAMAPAVRDTLLRHFAGTKTKPEDYDLILTGDLGKLGSEILIDLMDDEGVTLGANYGDCGQMYYKRQQKTLCGGSGAGCCATVFNSYVMQKLREKQYKKILFLPTGALLSTTSTQQGDTIPSVCHAIVIEA
ncbi:MAG: stage V sporulation protein AD, partial [Clostridia bacterium]|nr:stage V sporulation protein AD [Clostridia bacterium]